MDKNFRMLGRRVKFLRIDKGIKQTDMANMIGLSQTNLSNMESGRTAITTQNLFKMRDVLGCKMADFFVEFDGEVEATEIKETAREKQSIELEDALTLLKLLKSMNIKGL